MTNTELAIKLRNHAEYLRQTPIAQPLKEVNTINHLLGCAESLSRLAEQLEKEGTKEEKSNEGRNEPEQNL